MKKLALSLVALSICLTGCPDNKEDNTNVDTPKLSYGAFLGRDDNNTKDFEKYEYLSFDFEGYQESTIRNLEKNGNHCMGYLNVGSVETYRDYYSTYESITFSDYENWDDERWVDVSNTSWQNFVINTLAKNIKNKGGYGVYMDNVDVYSVAKEDSSMRSKMSAIAAGLKSIINGVKNLGLKVMVNGGAEFFDDFEDIRSSVWGYHQEEVFSLILDYKKDKFGKQAKDDKEYYQSIADTMKKKGCEVFFLEYTKDTNLIKEIETYCKSKNYRYYVSSTVGLY